MIQIFKIFRITAVIGLLNFAVQSSFGQTEAPLILDLATSQPSQNEKLSSVSEFIFSFNFEKVYNAYPDVEKADFGICASMGEEKYITVYKGDVETGDVLFTINQSISTRSKLFAPGETSLKLSLDQTYILEPGEKYTVHIPARVFYTRTKATSYDTYAEEYQYIFYGEESSEDGLLLVEETPKRGSLIDNINEIQLEFNSAISVSSDALILLKEGSNIIGEGKVEVDSENENVALIQFSDTPLYNSHSYVVEVPSDIIFIKDTNIGNSEITLIYTGTSLKYHKYGRVSPSNGSDVSYLTSITVPVNADDNLELGRAKAPKAYFYEGNSSDALETITCEMNGENDGWIIPVWYFDMQPSSTYRIVVPADQYHLWYRNDAGNFVEAKDTSNPELVLTYTTPAELEKAPVFTFSQTVPGEGETLASVETVKVPVAPYEIETISYLPTLIAEHPEAQFMQDGELLKSVPLTLNFEEDNEANQAFLSAVVDEVMVKGHSYSLVIPAGIIGPEVGPTMTEAQASSFRNAVKNEEMTITFNGSTPTEAMVTYYIGETGSMSTIVKIGETVTVNVAGSEDWKVKDLLFNGEPVEAEGDEYVTSAITADATIAVTYEYAHEIDFDYTTGVGEIEDCPYALSSNAGHLVISGLNEGDAITIYTIGGMKVADLPAVPAKMHEASISLPEGKVYIMMINGVSIKYKH
ncbi:MAG: hypothetical protein K2H96_05395 [Muribaculaceae bacterium]|nr:hypothetical protein [Muribaculaceae bacterium]